MNRISDRIEALRRFMQTKGISAFITQYRPSFWRICTCSLGISEMDFRIHRFGWYSCNHHVTRRIMDRLPLFYRQKNNFKEAD